MTDMLFIAQIPRYLYMKYSVCRTRRAIAYWFEDGLLVDGKRVYLEVNKTSAGQLYTRKAWVDDFIEKMGRRSRK